MKKRIGVSFTETNYQNYLNWFTADDLIDDLEIVKLSCEASNTLAIYSCDGFLLTGGIDIDPSVFKGSINYENRPEVFSLQRDLYEEKLYRYSQVHKLPVLGICRGLQLVNVLEGGKLIQDLGEAGNSRHRKISADDKQHAVRVEPGSLLAETTGELSGFTNSAHHQAINPSAIGENLKVNALADDETIEGIEFSDKTGKAFMLCVQWHPERMNNKAENPFSHQLKSAFLTAVRNTSVKKQSIINPVTEEVIAELTEDTSQSLNLKFEILRSGQPDFAAISLNERINILKKFSELLEENSDELARILTSEVGKPLKQSRNEINGAKTRINWLTANAERYLSDETMHLEVGLEERISYEPLGIVCNISAWNYPYLVGVNVIVPALLAGNAVLYKPSEHALLTGLEIEKLLKQAGIPENVFQIAVGGGDIGAALLELPFDGYFFTGSYKTGQRIYEKVAPKMVPCQCEMGGKDPLYVAEDVVDIASVAAGTADGAFYNNGQSCCAVERIYVHEKVYDQYVDEFLKEVNSWKTGSPLNDDNYIGALTRKDQLSTLENQVADAVRKGATILTGGKRLIGTGYFFEPTVLINVNHDMLLMKEESFGPLIGIMKVKNDEEAIRLMQDTEYGLTAAVYSADRSKAERILKEINAGSAYWNCCDRVSAALPWSGRKHSGFGSTLSHAGLRAFTKPKAFHLKF